MTLEHLFNLELENRTCIGIPNNLAILDLNISFKYRKDTLYNYQLVAFKAVKNEYP